MSSFAITKTQGLNVVENVDVDTVVVPARPESCERVFLGEYRWYPIRMADKLRTRIKHIAVYQAVPRSAITHIALIRTIERWDEKGRLVVTFADFPRPIGPIRLRQGGRIGGLQGLRYTKLDVLMKAQTLDDVW